LRSWLLLGLHRAAVVHDLFGAIAFCIHLSSAASVRRHKG